MIKYKLKNQPIKSFSFSYLEDYLKNLGIEKINSFIKEPAKEDEEDCFNLENMEETIDVLHQTFTQNKKFFLQVDSDADGFTSAAIFYSFFKNIFPNSEITYRLHDEKEHGVILDEIPIESDVIIIPDAGSMQFEEQQKLSDQGRIVVILDHHKSEKYIKIPNVFIVNNQLSPNFKNKNLSGAGIVYKTIQAYTKKYLDTVGDEFYSKYADLTALGIISDMMDTKQLDTNFIIKKGLKNIKNPMFRALLEKQNFSIPDISEPTKIDVAFYISPIINGVIRFGTEEEKDNLFQGLINYNAKEIIETVYHGNLRKEHYYDYIARISYNVKERQNREKLKILKMLTEKIEQEELQNNQLLVVIVSKDEVPKTITGLVAMELLKKYKKPTLVLRPRNENGKIFYAGSGRGKANGDFDSLHYFLSQSGLCEYVEGHDMAHGVSIAEENLPKIIEYANKKLSDIEFDVEEAEVDYIFHNGNLNRDMLFEFGDNLHLYGNGIPQPKFAFKLNVLDSQIKTLGKTSDTIKFFLSGIEFIKFKDKKLSEFLENSEADTFEIEFIGRAQINTWMNKKTIQIIIDSLNIKEMESALLF